LLAWAWWPSVKYLAGIDPGYSGAIALLDPNNLTDLILIDMPLHRLKVNGRNTARLDLYQLGNFFDLHRLDIRAACIEEPSAMPSQGVASSFNFGFSCGATQAAVAANAIPMRLVRPATWKRAMGLSADKDASRRLASQRLPMHAAKWARAKDDGRAEAVLLAIYLIHHKEISS